jgi:hypothetical protein
MKRIFIFSFFLIVMLMKANPQAPEFYNKVNHMIWIVEDLRTVKKNWQQLGFGQIKEEGDVTIISKFSEEGEPVKARMATGYLDTLRVVWIQVPKKGSPFSDYMRISKEGVYSLVYAVEGKKALKDEAQRLRDIGINIQDNLELRTSHGKYNYYLFNTLKQGKFMLGFLFNTEAEKLFDPALHGVNKHNLKFAQYAFAITKAESVSDYWYDFGLPELTITHDSIGNRTYYDKPGVFDIELGWQQHGSIPFEWCIPLQGPNVYEDHIVLHGEGFHHIAFETSDLDSVLTDYKAKGFVVSQSGTWGIPGKPGSGRFAYLDPKGLGGITIELLWNYKP